METAVRRVRVGGRSERVVQDVLAAVITELGSHGYAGLRVEEVASRAAVNKTTIYRRWPTKAALVEAALRNLRPPTTTPDSGTLAGDLLALAMEVAGRATSPEKKGLMRVFNFELDHPEVAAIAKTLRGEQQVTWRAVIVRGIARGELPRRADPELIVELTWGLISQRARLNEAMPRSWLESRIAVILAGVRALG